jgi:uncharacterized protein YdhG (YjbR/CyaY superfamily)
MQSNAKSVAEYLASLPEDRRAIVSAVRDVINKNLPKGYAESMQYGMIGWSVPHSAYPAGYHCDPRQPVPFAGLASQKAYVSLYLMCSYGMDEERQHLIEGFAKAKKKLDMGKGCIRFKKLADLPLDVVGRAIKRVPLARFLAHYESAVQAEGKRPRQAAAKKKAAKKKKPAKRS